MAKLASSVAINPQRATRERTVVALLTGADAAQMLSVAMAHRGIVRSWNVHSVHHRPGAGVSVGYSVVVDHTDRGGAVERYESYVVATSSKIDEERLAELDGRTVTWQDVRIHVWEHPNDPELPALAIACDLHEVAQWQPQVSDIELVAYRPTRRAVVKLLDDAGAPFQWAKVMRANQVDGVVKRLRILARAGVPVPELAHVDTRGLVVTEHLDGVPLNKVFAQVLPEHLGQMRVVLNSLAEVLDRLPMVATGLVARPAWAERSAHYAEAAINVLPDQAERIRALDCQIQAQLAEADLGPVVATHGDFYEANIFINHSDGSVSGILDVDSLGPGYRVHDWGCLLGHMSVLPGLAPRTYRTVDALVADWTAQVAQWVDPQALGASAAGVVLSLIAGARRNKKGWQAEALFRLEVAENWLIHQ